MFPLINLSQFDNSFWILTMFLFLISFIFLEKKTNEKFLKLNFDSETQKKLQRTDVSIKNLSLTFGLGGLFMYLLSQIFAFKNSSFLALLSIIFVLIFRKFSKLQKKYKDEFRKKNISLQPKENKDQFVVLDKDLFSQIKSLSSMGQKLFIFSLIFPVYIIIIYLIFFTHGDFLGNYVNDILSSLIVFFLIFSAFGFYFILKSNKLVLTAFHGGLLMKCSVCQTVAAPKTQGFKPDFMDYLFLFSRNKSFLRLSFMYLRGPKKMRVSCQKCNNSNF